MRLLENRELLKYADSVIVKGVKSPERLLDETALFLHQVIAQMPEEKQLTIKRLYDNEAVLVGKDILIVDDDTRNAFALSKLLADKGLKFNVLLGNAQFLAEKTGRLSEDDVQDITQGIYNGAKAVYNLLTNLLMWAQLQHEGGIKCYPEPIALRELVGETLAVLGQTAVQKEIELINTVPPDFWVQADRRMLEMIIRNLTGNALKFTPRGGQVILGGHKNGLNGQSGLVRVSVQDTGVGMDLADAAKLFRIDTCRSTMGTERERGSGLGLIICKEMVERHGGEIWVKSQVGKGTTVEFTVPGAPALARLGSFREVSCE